MIQYCRVHTIYRETSNTSRVSNTSRGSGAFVTIEAGSLIVAGITSAVYSLNVAEVIDFRPTVLIK